MGEWNEQSGKDIERRLVRYLDGELSDREALELERRVERDQRLGELLRQHAALDGQLVGLRDRGAENLDTELQRADIVAALERKVLLEGPSRRRRVVRLRPLAAGVAAAAVVAIAATFMLMLPGEREPSQSPAEPVVRASMLPAASASSGEGYVDARPLPIAQMQMRLSSEFESESDVPSGTVYVSSGSPRPDVTGQTDEQYPIEWTFTETY